jgi:GntR family transcriptional regulator/MocR family aminotransferase
MSIIKLRFVKGQFAVFIFVLIVIINNCFINSRTSLKTTAAKEYQFAIIEDDYDYDFQFEGLAMLPMASSDANGMVIYLGKLGR